MEYKFQGLKFDIAYNFEMELIDEMQEIGNVHSVFAKLNTDLVGGGRPSASLPDISCKDLKMHIDKVHQADIRFNYLLNAVCLNNSELSKEKFLEMRTYMDEIVALGVDSVTVANPFLCDMIKERYPDLETCLSVNARVGSLQQIKYWEDFGIDEITLDQIVNRDFELLGRILCHTKQSGTRIRLFANNICLHDCPMRTYHALANTHASQTQNELKEHLHYYYYKCTEMKLTNPMKLIAATWIRPDDVHYYYDLMKETGNYNVILKLAERSSKSRYLTKILRAYQQGRYDGNLMDIIYAIQGKYLLPPDKKETGNYYSPERVREIMKLFDLDWYVINNRELDGFLDGFLHKFQCRNKICSDKKYSDECCTYCYTWAKKAVSYEEDKMTEYRENLHKILKAMQNGEIFV